MSIFLIILALGSIVGGIVMLKRSAKKFDVTPEQLKKINERNKIIEKKEKEYEE